MQTFIKFTHKRTWVINPHFTKVDYLIFQPMVNQKNKLERSGKVPELLLVITDGQGGKNGILKAQLEPLSTKVNNL